MRTAEKLAAGNAYKEIIILTISGLKRGKK